MSNIEDDEFLQELKSAVDKGMAARDPDQILDATIAFLERFASLVPGELARIRSAAIEEAAKVADSDWSGGFPESDLGAVVIETGDRIATAIRALKDKPHE